jgi:hypothetical protein
VYGIRVSARSGRYCLKRQTGGQVDFMLMIYKPILHKITPGNKWIDRREWMARRPEDEDDLWYTNAGEVGEVDGGETDNK